MPNGDRGEKHPPSVCHGERPTLSPPGGPTAHIRSVWEFSEHARRRMAQRGISEEQVRRWLGTHDPVSGGPRGALLFRCVGPGGKIVRIVTNARKTVVVTVYWEGD